MNFLKKLTGSAEGAAGGAETSVTSMVTQAARSVGLDPKGEKQSLPDLSYRLRKGQRKNSRDLTL